MMKTLCLIRPQVILMPLVFILLSAFVPGQTLAQQDLSGTEFTYSPSGKRDPFQSLLNSERETRKKAPTARLTPIQKFELGQFRLQAVLIGKGKPKAMLSAPDGKTYIVSPGIKIGKRSGVITDITQSGIHVEEIDYDNITGKEKKENELIRMPEQKAF